METHNIDSKFRKAITESEGFYDTKANAAKADIWNQVQLNKQNKTKPLLLRLLAAACIILFLSTTAMFITNVKNKTTIDTLVELNKSLKQTATTNTINTSSSEERIMAVNSVTDTVYIEKKVLVNTPIIRTQYITDTVYVNQIVYVEKEQEPTLIATGERPFISDSIIQKSEGNYKKEIQITNNEAVKREKKKKFQIKIGGNSDRGNSGALAFTSEL